MAATDTQVQSWSDAFARPWCEHIRNTDISAANNNLQVTDILNNSTWVDTRQDVPAQLVRTDLAAINTVSVKLDAIINGADDTDANLAALVRQLRGQWPIVRKACVRQPISN